MFVSMAVQEPLIESQDRAAMIDPFVQLAFLNDAIDDLTAANLDLLDAEWFARYARSVDELTARLNAISIEATAEARHRGHDRHCGFFSMKAWIKHHVQLTGSEAHGRIQTMRMFDLLPTWAAAARSGEVGVAQTRLMARVAANPRIHAGTTPVCRIAAR